MTTLFHRPAARARHRHRNPRGPPLVELGSASRDASVRPRRACFSYERTPKSDVMMTTLRPPNTPGAAGTETAERPTSRQRAARMFARCPGLSIQSFTAAEASSSARRPQQVLADRPPAEAARAVEPLDALPERRAVARIVLEVAERAHGARVFVGGSRKRPREADRNEPVRAPDRVQLLENAALEVGRPPQGVRVGVPAAVAPMAPRLRNVSAQTTTTREGNRRATHRQSAIHPSSASLDRVILPTRYWGRRGRRLYRRRRRIGARTSARRCLSQSTRIT